MPKETSCDKLKRRLAEKRPEPVTFNWLTTQDGRRGGTSEALEGTPREPFPVSAAPGLNPLFVTN